MVFAVSRFSPSRVVIIAHSLLFIFPWEEAAGLSWGGQVLQKHNPEYLSAEKLCLFFPI